MSVDEDPGMRHLAEDEQRAARTRLETLEPEL